MGTVTSLKDLPTGSFGDNKEIVSWLLNKPENEQQELAESYLQHLLASAANINAVSSNHSCLNLCYFVDKCRKSKSSALKDLAFSQDTCLKLFDFYLEWSDRNNQKAMKQVLDSTAALLSQNPHKSKAIATKEAILQRIATAISHKALQSFVKPAFKSLEIFLGKKSVTSLDILKSYIAVVDAGSPAFYNSLPNPKDGDFDALIAASFTWMSLPDVSPAAGKFLVTLFVDLRTFSAKACGPQHASLWRNWIIKGLQDHPDSLENIKNHLLPLIFKQDRSGSIEFLQELTQQVDFSSGVNGDLSGNAALLLAAMEVGKKYGLVEDANINEELMGRSKRRDHILLPEQAIGDLLSHTSSSIRSAALSVLVTSTSYTRPFTAETLDFLRQNLGYMHADTDAQLRNNVISSTRNMLHRLEHAMRYLGGQLRGQTEPTETSSVNPVTIENASKLLKIHHNFMDWYLSFLAKELAPTASYQRHITALRAFLSLPEMKYIDHTYGPHLPIVFNPNIRRLVLDLVADPFEDVRSCSAFILRSIGMNTNLDQEWKNMGSPRSWIRDRSVIEKSSLRVLRDVEVGTDCVLDPNLILEFVANVGKAARRTGRADLSDGEARAYEVLYSLTPLQTVYYGQELLSGIVLNLEESIQIAQTNLAHAVRGYPVHGDFASLFLIVESISADALRLPHMHEDGGQAMIRRWDGITQRLIYCCKNMWERVEQVLCNDSPEGHLPRGLQINDFEGIDTKELLSYSFRAIHESSNLIRAMVSKMNLRFVDDSLFLDQKQFEEIGNLSFKQLASLRHRGAFSTVSLTFAKCCQQTQNLSLSIIEKNAILQKWYQGSLDCIFEQVSTTRRSAGIPALITGILSANAENPSFGSIMTELQNLAKRPVQLSETDETNLPQVHAMNCMKEIYKSSVLSKKSELYIASGLQLAAECLQSDIWAMRNCGLLLLRSLIDRMFGTNESKIVTDAGWDGLSIKLSYDKYGALPDLLIKLLDVQTDTSLSTTEKEDRAIQTVFPALDIIRRAGPPVQYRNQIYDLVSRHLGSRVWHVRDIAARTMCTLITEDWVNSALELLKSCLESSNRCHGILMTLKYVLEKLDASKSSLSSDILVFISKFRDIQETSAIFRRSPYVRAAYVEVVSAVLKIFHNLPSSYSGEPLETAIQLLLLHSYELVTEGSLFSSDDVVLSSDLERYSSLCRNACGFQRVLATAIGRHVPRLKVFVLDMVEKDVDTACAMLDAIPTMGSVLSSDLELLKEIADLYMAVLLKTISSQVQSITSKNLAVVLDKLTGMGEFGNPSPTIIDRSILAFDMSRGSPELSNARIRLSGSLLIRQVRIAGGSLQKGETSQLEKQLLEWGKMLSDSGHANNDFDTRYAAVEALEAFYNHLQESEITSCAAFAPSLLALYDALVDDDDEVRDVSARTVSKILGSCLIPLAAQTKFFLWLENNFSGNQSLCGTTLARLTGGHAEPISSRLSIALKEDDTLFVEEEQNLFSDEIRETRVWVEILAHAKGIAWEDVITILTSWVVDGLDVIRSTAIAETVDGPRGWTSNPQVFAICMRTILTGNALIARYTNIAAQKDLQASDSDTDKHLKSIVDGMEALLEVGIKHRLHESLLEEVKSGLGGHL